MPRRQRIPSPIGIYHWMVRGIHQNNLFSDEKDFSRFKSQLLEYKSVYGISIYHYCLMTNHVHMLIKQDDMEEISLFSHFILRKYAYYFCKKYLWKGAVFQSPYKLLPVKDETYLLECGRYIERNPLGAFLVKRPEDYPYSSYRFYKFGENDSLVTPSPGFLGLDERDETARKLYASYVELPRDKEKELDRALKRK